MLNTKVAKNILQILYKLIIFTSVKTLPDNMFQLVQVQLPASSQPMDRKRKLRVASRTFLVRISWSRKCVHMKAGRRRRLQWRQIALWCFALSGTEPSLECVNCVPFRSKRCSRCGWSHRRRNRSEGCPDVYLQGQWCNRWWTWQRWTWSGFGSV